MPITYFPLNVDVSQVVGFPVKVARLEVSTSLPKGTVLAYGSAGQIAVPGGIYNLAGGIGTLTLPTKTGLTNVSDYQYVITGEYSLDGVRPVKMDPIYIDAPTSTDAVNLASFIGVTSAPPTFMGQAVAQLQAKVDEAEAIKQYVNDVSNIDTTVSAVDFALTEPGPAATLSNAIGDGLDGRVKRTVVGDGVNIELVGHPENVIAPDVTASVLLGDGRPGQENVIGRGVYANVGTATSNLPANPADLLNPSASTRANHSLVGGYDNVAGGLKSVIFADHSYIREGASHCGILSGATHKIDAGHYSTVGGGYINSIVEGLNSTIPGGRENTINIPGGGNGTVSGFKNTLTGSGGSIFGVQNNGAGQGVFLLGMYNTTTQNYSGALGFQAASRHIGQVAFAAGAFVTAGDAQTSVHLQRKETTSATTTFMANPYLPSTGQTVAYRVIVTARDVATGMSKVWEAKGAVRKVGTGNVQAVGGALPAATVIAEDTGTATWTFAPTVSSTTASYNVTGEAGKTIRWVSRTELVEVSS